jgi:hypothetical protein
MIRFLDVAVTTIIPASLLILYKSSFPIGLKMSSVSNLASKSLTEFSYGVQGMY